MHTIDLFPDLQKIPQPSERRRYVENRLLKMARAGTLRCTDLVNQPEWARMQISLVLQGERLEKAGMYGFIPEQVVGGCPVELRSYPVRLKAVKHVPLKWKAGFEDLPVELVGRDSRHVPVRERWMHPCGEGAMEGDVPLPDAFIMLDRHGEHRGQRQSRWSQNLFLYKEVDRQAEVKEPRRRNRRPESEEVADAQ